MQARPGRVVVDAMHGAGRDYIKDFLNGTGWEVTQIRGDMNPGFGGIHPEPILPHLNALVDAVKESNGAFGLATDGDADRTGAVDEDGNFVSPHVIFALALRYLVETRGLRGSVVKTVSTTLMIDRICRDYGLKLYETPVGFNHIADLMTKDDVLIGGEESGGIGIRGHIPEGDGVLMGLLLLEIVAQAGVPLKDAHRRFAAEIRAASLRPQRSAVSPSGGEEGNGEAADRGGADLDRRGERERGAHERRGEVSAGR